MANALDAALLAAENTAEALHELRAAAEANDAPDSIAAWKRAWTEHVEGREHLLAVGVRLGAVG